MLSECSLLLCLLVKNSISLAP